MGWCTHSVRACYIEAIEDLNNDSGQWKDPGSSHFD
jgi:hypothetical protein